MKKIKLPPLRFKALSGIAFLDLEESRVGCSAVVGDTEGLGDNCAQGEHGYAFPAAGSSSASKSWC